MRWFVSERAESRASPKLETVTARRRIERFPIYLRSDRVIDIEMSLSMARSPSLCVLSCMHPLRDVEKLFTHTSLARERKKEGKQKMRVTNRCHCLCLPGCFCWMHSVFSPSLSLSSHAHTLWRRTQTTVFANAAVQYIHP